MKNIQEVFEWIDAEIEKIDKDERFHYKPALVQVNAPLALIQVEMIARRSALWQVRGNLVKVFNSGT